MHTLTKHCLSVNDGISWIIALFPQKKAIKHTDSNRDCQSKIFNLESMFGSMGVQSYTKDEFMESLSIREPGFTTGEPTGPRDGLWTLIK